MFKFNPKPYSVEVTKRTSNPLNFSVSEVLAPVTTNYASSKCTIDSCSFDLYSNDHDLLGRLSYIELSAGFNSCF